MSDKGKNKSWFSSILRPFKICLNGGDTKTIKGNKAKEHSDPEATIVAASKHFSSAHKQKELLIKVYTQKFVSKSKNMGGYSYKGAMKKKIFSLWSDFIRFFSINLAGDDIVKTTKAGAPRGGGADATMVAAMKHFSVPHKVRFG
ncbi:hypothetical protein G2W53_019093 [Senna tora]|uniref:Uncharacterized protein n=1 Tax=Senna tora TaxID=362788 RepID=A0A834WRU9_9FABA|nr:hypothetical protein G2W53_019093 [Senna tora]